MEDNKTPRVMHGFPPAPETRISGENWFKNPFLRWSLMSRQAMVPTVPVWRGDGPVSALPPAPLALDDLPVTGLEGERSTLLALLEAMEIDGFMVLHQGRCVYQRHFHGMQPHTLHGSASISKSFIGALVGVLEAQGVVDLSKTAEYYVPEMRGSAMGDATLRQLMDMQAGIQRPELAGRPDTVGAQDGGVFEILGLMPRRPDTAADFYDFVLKKPRGGAHGSSFFYDNGQVEAVAWPLRRATGKSIAELLSELVWAPLGPARDAFYSVDKAGAEFTAGGLGLTLGDMARFGEMLRCEGWYNGRQIVPAAFLADVRRGGDQALFRQGAFSAVYPTGSYRSFFWPLHDDVGAFQCNGRYGQRLYVCPRAELVIAQFGAWDGPARPNRFDKPNVRLLRELAGHFIGA